MKIKIKHLFFYVLLSSQAIAQNDFRPGFVILNSGDTLKGKIDYCRENSLESFCRFKGYNNDSIKEFTPNDILGYCFINGRYFVPKQFDQNGNSKKVFFEFLFHGKVDLYSYNGSFYIEKSGLNLREIPYIESSKYVDGVEYEYSTKTHIGILEIYMQDVPELHKKIENIEKINKQNLLKLAKEYHKQSNEKTNYIIYGGNLPLVSISIEPMIGFTKYKSFDKYFEDIGIYALFNLPQEFDRLYFKTGIVYHKIQDSGNYVNIYKVPLQFEYLFKSKGFIPIIDIGLNYLTLTNSEMNVNVPTHTYIIGCGFQYNVFKNLKFSANINTEFTPIDKVMFGNSKFRMIDYYCHFGIIILII